MVGTVGFVQAGGGEYPPADTKAENETGESAPPPLHDAIFVVPTKIVLLALQALPLRPPPEGISMVAPAGSVNELFVVKESVPAMMSFVTPAGSVVAEFTVTTTPATIVTTPVQAEKGLVEVVTLELIVQSASALEGIKKAQNTKNNVALCANRLGFIDG